MPKTSFHLAIRRVIFISLTCFALLLCSCGTQARAQLPRSAQKFLPKSSLVQVSTATPTPETIFVHDSVSLVYALVAPFPTVIDGVSSEDLQRAWAEGLAPEAFRSHPLLMDESTRAAFRALWGEPASSAVQVVSAGRLLETA